MLFIQNAKICTNEYVFFRVLLVCFHFAINMLNIAIIFASVICGHILCMSGSQCSSLGEAMETCFGAPQQAEVGICT